MQRPGFRSPVKSSSMSGGSVAVAAGGTTVAVGGAGEAGSAVQVGTMVVVGIATVGGTTLGTALAACPITVGVAAGGAVGATVALGPHAAATVRATASRVRRGKRRTRAVGRLKAGIDLVRDGRTQARGRGEANGPSA